MGIRVVVACGTRPEVIKLAPVVQALRDAGGFDVCLCVTAQHRDMLDQALEVFDLRPDVDLNVMRPAQTLAQTTAAVVAGVDRVLADYRPEWLVVQGDTTTTMAAALAAFYRGVRIAHVEAGLRTGDRRSPFPEEINRRIADLVADVYFPPTETAAANLAREGVSAGSIVVTGNTGIDALLRVLASDRPSAIDPLLIQLRGRRIVTLTTHRRESFGGPLERTCAAIERLVRLYPDDVHVVCPVHQNPSVRSAVRAALGASAGVTLLDPLDYLSFARLLQASYLVLTDSGGVQEEAPSLRKPVLVLRDATERPEAVEAGIAKIVGTDADRIVAAASRLLNDAAEYEAMRAGRNPFGDGKAAERIARDLYSRIR